MKIAGYEVSICTSALKKVAYVVLFFIFSASKS